MDELISRINAMQRSNREVCKRVREFIKKQKESNKAWFSELCFCILTANSTAESGLRCQSQVGPGGFLDLTERSLARELKRAGHRFPNARARFIVSARRLWKIKDIIRSFDDPNKARAWLVKNVKGIGWKEASHFLRNVGYLDFAILDRHVLRILHEYGIIDEIPHHLSEKKYMEIEEKMKKIAEKAGMRLGELDLYLWCMKTGRVLK